MRLSEAMKLGSMLAPQAYGDYVADGATCAMGAAAQAIGLPADAEDEILEAWPELDKERDLMCPHRHCRKHHKGLMLLVIHLNDDHMWAREQIADWVATVEPAESTPSVDVAQSAERTAVRG